MRDRISQAIDTTKRVVPGYFEKTCAQRLPSEGCGSVVEGYNSAEELEEALKNANWATYNSDELMPGTTAYITTDIHGRIGVVALAMLDGETTVVLDDRKGTGKVSCTVKGALGPRTDCTVIILGEEQGEEVVFTFHPGGPVRASQVTCEPGMHGKEVTAAEALHMGLSTAKIVA